MKLENDENISFSGQTPPGLLARQLMMMVTMRMVMAVKIPEDS